MEHYQRLVPCQLSDGQIETWDRIVSEVEGLESPYFRPEYALAVATVRPTVEFVMVGDPTRPEAIWGYQRRQADVGDPIGGPLNDLQGIVTSSNRKIDSKKLLATAGLKRWRFHHLSRQCDTFWPSHTRIDPSPFLDLSDGFQAYYDAQQQRHPRTFHDLAKRAHRLSAEHGPLRLEFDVRDPQQLQQLIAWKRDQYRRTSVADVFAVPWTVALLKRLHSEQGNTKFRGLLSVLYAGDRPVAMHFGLRSLHVLHCWFPTYDLSVSRWSPGLQLFVQLAQAAATQGVTRIDLGKGDEPFKEKLASGFYDVADGVAGEDRARRQLRRNICGVQRWLRSSALGTPLATMVRRFYPNRQMSRFA